MNIRVRWDAEEGVWRWTMRYQNEVHQGWSMTRSGAFMYALASGGLMIDPRGYGIAPGTRYKA